MFFLSVGETISSDSLLKICKKSKSVYEAFEHIDIKDIDVKSCELNDDLKPFLLKFLDVDSYTDYLTKITVDRVIDDEFESWVHKQPLYFRDSISNDFNLYSSYKDSFRLDLYKDKHKRTLAYINIPKESELFFYIKWAEAYEKLVGLWRCYYSFDEDKKNKVTYIKKVYKCLLKYQDPEAWKYRIETEMPKEIMKNSYTFRDLKVFDYSLFEILGGKKCCIYDVKLFLSLLQYNKCYGIVRNYAGFGDPDDLTICPFNVGLLYYSYWGYYLRYSKNPIVRDIMTSLFSTRYDELVANFYTENRGDRKKELPINNLPLEELEKISKRIIDNSDAFEDALQPLIDEYEKRDYYWKSTMPYYENR